MQHAGQHTLVRGASVEVGLRRACAGALLAIVTIPAGGCSMSFPMSSINPGKDDITGSIRPSGEREDARRAKAALATALDPQGDGTLVKWDNPATKHAGTFTPVGHAYPSEGRVCRKFIATTHTPEGKKTVHGTACSAMAGEWAVVQGKSDASS